MIGNWTKEGFKELWWKLGATAHSYWTEFKCKHGPWIIDPYSTLPKGVPSAHCKQCWKTLPRTHKLIIAQGSRWETRDEMVERYVSGGTPREQAEREADRDSLR